MKFSYEKIGAWSATFATETAVEGQVVKMSADHTVAACSTTMYSAVGRRGAQRYLRCADERVWLRYATAAAHLLSVMRHWRLTARAASALHLAVRRIWWYPLIQPKKHVLSKL